MVDRCEAEFGREWDAICGHEIAGGTAWPSDVADAVKRLCFTGGADHPSLCADRRRNRSTIEQTIEALKELLQRSGGDTSTAGSDAVDESRRLAVVHETSRP